MKIGRSLWILSWRFVRRAIVAVSVLAVGVGWVWSGPGLPRRGSVQAASLPATLVRSIDTSAWSPPSPDPAGISYWWGRGTLLVSDSEVEEMPNYFVGKNVFEASTSGTLLGTATTMAFSKEPTGAAVNPTNGHVFFSDDSRKRIYEVDLGPDGALGTGDDVVKSISTRAFGSSDPEGVGYGGGNLYIADGAGTEVYAVNPGVNAIFDGVPPTGDDQVTHFDTLAMGLPDPEGIEYNPDRNTLYIASRKATFLAETTTTGQLLNTIDVSFLNTKTLAGVAYGPGSLDPSVNSIYLADRKIDNNSDPNENDGKIYEIMLATGPTPTPTPTVGPTPTPTATPTPTPVPTPTPTPVQSTSISLTPIADTYAYLTSPTSNFGTAKTIQVDGSPVKIGYLTFDLGPLAGKSILSAKLRMKITSSSTSTQVIKDVPDTSWSETTLTYNNRPALTTTITSFTKSTSGTWKEVDITASVTSRQGQIFSFGMDSSGGDGLDFYSKENATDNVHIFVAYQ